MTLATAMTDATKHKARDEHEKVEGARFTIDPVEVATLIEGWPEAPKKAARKMMEQYGRRMKRRRRSSSGTGIGRGSEPS